MLLTYSSTLTLGHTEDVAEGAEITITGNTELGTFTTSADRVTKFVVTGNTKLGTFNAASIKTLPANASTSSTFIFTVTGNGVKLATATTDALSSYTGFKGTYTPLSATVARSYGQASVATLKPYLQSIYDRAYPASGVTATLTAGSIDLDFGFLVDNTATGSATAATTTLVLANNTLAFSVDVSGTVNDVTVATVQAGFQEILKVQ